MNKLVHLVLFSVALAILAGCPPHGVGPTPPRPGNCEVPGLVGELPEVKQWEGTLPELSVEQPTWVAIPTETGAVYIAVDTLHRTVPVAVHVTEVDRPTVEGRLLGKLELVIIGGVRGPRPGPGPVGDGELIRFAYETAMKVNQTKVNAIERGVLKPLGQVANPVGDLQLKR